MFVKLRNWWNNDAQDDMREIVAFGAGAACGFCVGIGLFALFFLFLRAVGAVQC